jgi:uncharacterized protein YbaR (Trm112 family)
MKSSKNNELRPCKCGSIEFITRPNQYDVYEIIDNNLELIRTEDTYEENILYCRECGDVYNLETS